MTQTAQDVYVDRLVRITLVAGVIFWSAILLYPFLGIFAWALILAVSLYPIYKWLTVHLGNRPVLAAVLLTMLNLFLLVGAIVLLTNNLFDGVSGMIEKLRQGDQLIPPPPASVNDFPMIGNYVYDAWTTASANISETLKEYSKYLVHAGTTALSLIANKTLHLFYFILSILLAGYLMTQGEAVNHNIHKFAERVALDRGAALIKIMGDTIHNVASGVIGIALLQTMIFGLLLLLAQIPGAGMLSFLAFILCIAQLGLILLVVPIIIWLFFTKSAVLASLISVGLILDTLIDNLLKPFVLSRGLTTPMLLIFIGVIGGIIEYGVIGIFIGPVILALFHSLVHQWLYLD